MEMLELQDLHKTFNPGTVNEKVALNGVSLKMEAGDFATIVGSNGAGKSTLFNAITGGFIADEGSIELGGQDITFAPEFERSRVIGHLFQDPLKGTAPNMTIEENLALAYLRAGTAPHAIFSRISRKDKELFRERLALLGMGLEDRMKQPVGLLSGGQRQALTLLMATLRKPDLLLLDEPTNHLDAESILWLEQFLHQYKGAVIAVTHDRYFMDNVAEWICEVDRGHLYPYKGNYSTYLETKAKRMEIQGAKDAKLAKRLKSELDWVRSSPKARQAKNKARLERYDQMEQEARNNKKLDFSEIQIPAGPRLGSTVLEAEHIHKAFGDRVLIDDLSFTLPRNGIVGVIGPNGVGKSTLFKTIVGLEPLTSGSLKIGDTVKISYVDQNRAGLDPNKNLWEAVSDGLDFIEVAGVEVPTRAYVASFGFKGSDQQKLVGVLSGGERNRLNLALTLKQGGNLLLLDEPTNDLDVETLESLENALLAFPGCAVVISHDRWFLDRVATHILAWEGTDENPANWYWFEGNFQAYQENRIARLGEDAARPHRLHRKLTR